jgi:glycerate dehydrogenase
MNIVCLDTGTFHWNEDLDLSPLRKFGSCVFHHKTAKTEISSRIAGAEVVITNKVVLGKPEFEGMNAVRFIQTASTGFNHVDVQAAREKGIPVANVVGYSTPCVSQWVMAALLTLSTRMPEYDRLCHAGVWCESPFYTLVGPPIFELRGKTLGIVGYGNIGKEVERLARAFGMNVLISGRPGHPAGEGRVPFDRVLSESDFLTIHAPLTPETEGLIGPDQLAKMKKGAYLLNAARGGIVDEKALKGVLQSGHLGGAALDVLKSEPPDKNHPLIGVKNCILTPHIAWASREARQRLIDEMAKGIQSFIDGNIRNRVV